MISDRSDRRSFDSSDSNDSYSRPYPPQRRQSDIFTAPEAIQRHSSPRRESYPSTGNAVKWSLLFSRVSDGAANLTSKESNQFVRSGREKLDFKVKARIEVQAESRRGSLSNGISVTAREGITSFFTASRRRSPSLNVVDDVRERHGAEKCFDIPTDDGDGFSPASTDGRTRSTWRDALQHDVFPCGPRSLHPPARCSTYSTSIGSAKSSQSSSPTLETGLFSDFKFQTGVLSPSSQDGCPIIPSRSSPRGTEIVTSFLPPIPISFSISSVANSCDSQALPPKGPRNLVFPSPPTTPSKSECFAAEVSTANSDARGVLRPSSSIDSVTSTDSSLSCGGIGIVGANGLVTASFQPRKISRAPWEEDGDEEAVGDAPDELDLMLGAQDRLKGAKCELAKFTRGWRDRSPPGNSRLSDPFLSSLPSQPIHLSLDIPSASGSAEMGNAGIGDDGRRCSSTFSEVSDYVDARAESPVMSLTEPVSPSALEFSTNVEERAPFVEFSRQQTSLWVLDALANFSGNETRRMSVIGEETEYEDSIVSRTDSRRRLDEKPLPQKPLPPVQDAEPVFVVDPSPPERARKNKKGLSLVAVSLSSLVPVAEERTALSSHCPKTPALPAVAIASPTSSSSSKQKLGGRIGTLFRKQSSPTLNFTRGVSPESLGLHEAWREEEQEESVDHGDAEDTNRKRARGSSESGRLLFEDEEFSNSSLSDHEYFDVTSSRKASTTTENTLVSTPQVLILIDKLEEFEREERLRLKGIAARRVISD